MENQKLRAAPAAASPPALPPKHAVGVAAAHDPWSSFLGDEDSSAELEVPAKAQNSGHQSQGKPQGKQAELRGECGPVSPPGALAGGPPNTSLPPAPGPALTGSELRALAGALTCSEHGPKAPPRAPPKPKATKPEASAPQPTASAGKASSSVGLTAVSSAALLTDEELETSLGKDTYLRALMERKDARRAKNVTSTPAPPAAVAAHMELTLRKPERSAVVGVQCDPSPDGAGVLIVAMDQQAHGFFAGLRVNDRLLSVDGERCTDPTLTATMLKAAVGKVKLEIVRSQVESRPKVHPLKFWKRK